MQQSAAASASQQEQWKETYAAYSRAYPELAAAFESALRGDLPDGWDSNLPNFAGSKPIATRAASGAVLDAIAPKIPTLLGGSADLTPSNNTLPKIARAVTREDFTGRYLHFGVREHAMGSILNGLALHGGVRPYGGTFLIFSDYMRPAIRLAALMKLPVIFVFTHDSIGLGEDGPTHQPVEQISSLRLIPNLAVFRPADAAETVEAWRFALARRNGPTALVLTRQALPIIDRACHAPADGAACGAYILRGVDDPEVILVATGSEVHLALAAQDILTAQKVRIRVVSMPCWELFDEQPNEYRAAVLPSAVRARVALEAGATLAWARYVGLDGEIVGLDRFGASAQQAVLYREFGITAEAVAEAARRVLFRVKRNCSALPKGTAQITEELSARSKKT
jgi:transketolase